MNEERIAEECEIGAQLDACQAKLEAINGIGELIGSLDLEVLLAKLMEISLFISSAQVGSVVLLEDGELVPSVEWGLTLENALKLRFVDGTSILERTIEENEAQFLPDFNDVEKYSAVEDLHVRSFMCVPLNSKRRTLGAINLVNSEGSSGHFTEIELDTILTVAGLAATALENAYLHQAALEKERIAAQLKMAQNVQEGLYPKEKPRVPGLEIGWLNVSCDETGGDYFDFIQPRAEELDLVIGDVSGHGIGSAMLMATGRASLRALLSSGDGDLREVVSVLNRLLEKDMDDSHFMTFFLGQLELESYALRFVNAGHDQPLIYSPARDRVTSLATTGMPLGLFPDSEYSCATAGHLEPGDVLLLTTDGVWEASNAVKERYGRDRLEAAFKRVSSLPAEEMLQALRSEVVAFTGAEAFHDDFTMVAVKRTG